MVNFSAIRGWVTIQLTPELRRVGLEHVREVDEGEDAEYLERWFSEEEHPDGYVLDATNNEAEAHMIVAIARAILWAYDGEPRQLTADEVEEFVRRTHDPS